MPKIKYAPWPSKKVNEEHQTIIDRSNEIILDYQGRGYDLTLRQLYYQFVSREWFPASWRRIVRDGKLVYSEDGTTNNERSYKNLGTILSDARRAGMVDWDAIVDRTRNVRDPGSWSSPSDMVKACAAQFDVDWWNDQPFRPEVWVEKDALIGVLEVACAPWRCPYFSCRGYASDSEVWSAARRLSRHIRNGQTPLVIHLGDHDPSGLDMTSDIEKRLVMLSGGKDIEVRRIALNMDQIEQYNPPPNPAKMTDSRFRNYMEEHGEHSWELDALSPEVITQLIADVMNEIVVEEQWAESERRRDDGRRRLTAVSDNWDTLTEGL